MLRLAFIGDLPEAANCQRLAPRLRGAEFTAIAESDAKEALRAAESLDVDAWIIAAQSTATDNDCRLAIATGKHVLLQSPTCVSPDALQGVAAAAEQTERRFMWGSPLRFLPSVKTMKESLAKGQLGELGLLRMHSWQSDPLNEISGNLLSELDLACWFFDEPPSLVYANSRKSDATSATSSQDDYVQIHLSFPTGGMALIDRVQVHPVRDDYFSLSLIGSSGAAYADDHHNMQLLYSRGHPAAIKTGQGDLALLAQLQEFINAIAENREPQPGVAELRRAIEVHAAATESIATGRAVPLQATVRDHRG